MKVLLSFTSFIILFSFGRCQSPTQPQANGKTDSIYIFAKPSADGIGKYYLGREISFVMGASGAAWLERNNRDQEENTKLAISKMELNPASVVADIGAGTGYYTFAIAPKVPKGKVFAVELQDELIAHLNKKKKSVNMQNVEIVKGEKQSPNLPLNTVDLAIMVDVYHELEFPHEMLQAIKASLKEKGKLLLLEYKAEDPSIAIKPLHKMSIQQATKEMAVNGFKLVYAGEFLPMQHFLLFQKNAN